MSVALNPFPSSQASTPQFLFLGSLFSSQVENRRLELTLFHGLSLPTGNCDAFADNAYSSPAGAIIGEVDGLSSLENSGAS